jgi:hypothetical protein
MRYMRPPTETVVPLDHDEVVEMMRGHWDCFDAAVHGEEALFALELALRDEPLSACAD